MRVDSHKSVWNGTIAHSFAIGDAATAAAVDAVVVDFILWNPKSLAAQLEKYKIYSLDFKNTRIELTLNRYNPIRRKPERMILDI